MGPPMLPPEQTAAPHSEVGDEVKQGIMELEEALSQHGGANSSTQPLGP